MHGHHYQTLGGLLNSLISVPTCSCPIIAVHCHTQCKKDFLLSLLATVKHFLPPLLVYMVVFCNTFTMLSHHNLCERIYTASIVRLLHTNAIALLQNIATVRYLILQFAWLQLVFMVYCPYTVITALNSYFPPILPYYLLIRTKLM